MFGSFLHCMVEKYPPDCSAPWLAGTSLHLGGTAVKRALHRSAWKPFFLGAVSRGGRRNTEGAQIAPANGVSADS